MGDLISYTATVTNIGSARARGTALALTMSPYLSPNAGLDSRCLIDGNGIINCDLGALNPGQTKQVSLGFDVDSDGSYVMSALASARKSDANPANNSAAHSFTAVHPAISPYVWFSPNNVLVSTSTNYSNGSSGIGRSYGTLYAPDLNGDGVGVIDGILSSYSLDLANQTIDVTRGVLPGTIMADDAAAIDSISYEMVELNPAAGVDDQSTLVCLYEDSNPAYIHPYTELFPLLNSRQAELTITTVSAWGVVSIAPKLAMFYANGTVMIDNQSYAYSGDRDSLTITDTNNSVVYFAVRSWNDRYMDFSPANFNAQTGNGTVTEIVFSP